MSARAWLIAAALLSLSAMSALLGARRAEAFTVRTAFTQACHEVMTLSALMEAVDSIDLERIPAPRTSKWESVVDWIASDLGVSMEDPRERFYYFSLLAGVRAPDTDGHSFSNLETVRALHVDPDGQHEHCLRAPYEDGSEGNLSAARGCVRVFIEAMEDASEAAEAEETRIFVPFMLDHYGRIELEAWAPAYHLGRALHVLQDSFSHTIRTPDLQALLHITNYAEAVSGSLRASRDGIAHSVATDRCDLDNAERASAAVEASIELLGLTGSSPERLRASVIKAFAARWLSLDESASRCTLANDFCDSPWLERALEEPTRPPLGCSASAPGADRDARGSLVALFAFSAIVGAWLLRRRAGARSILSLFLMAQLLSAGCVSSVDREPIEVYFVASAAGPEEIDRAAQIARFLSRPHASLEISLSGDHPDDDDYEETLARWFEASAVEDAASTERKTRLLITLGRAQGEALEDLGCLPEGWRGLHIGAPIDCEGVDVAIPPDHSAGFLAGALAAEEARPSLAAIVVEDDSPLTDGLIEGLAYRGALADPLEESEGDEARDRALADELFDEGAELLIVSGAEAQRAAIASAEERGYRRRDARLILLDPEGDLGRRREVLAFVRVRFARMLDEAIRDVVRGELAPTVKLYGAADGFVDVLYTRGELDDDDDDEDEDDYERWPRAVERRLRELADASALAHLD